MSEFLLVSALIGTTLLIVRSTIFAPVRRLWPALLGCAQCCGFWVGIGASWLIPTGHAWLLNTVIVGAATSFLSLLADAVLLTLLGDPSEKR